MLKSGTFLGLEYQLEHQSLPHLSLENKMPQDTRQPVFSKLKLNAPNPLLFMDIWIYVCACSSVCAPCACRCPHGPEQSTGSPDPGVQEAVSSPREIWNLSRAAHAHGLEPSPAPLPIKQTLPQRHRTVPEPDTRLGPPQA